MSDQRSGSNNMPMFYRSLSPVDPVRHGNKYIRRPGFDFARKTNAIPLFAEEFVMAEAYYPIVFAEGPSPIPVAIVGLEEDVNIFVNENSNWLESTYLPIYVRRYPFLAVDDSENRQFVLCVDDESEFLYDEEGDALFERGEPSSFLKSAMEFCVDSLHKGRTTEVFVEALERYNLFERIDGSITLDEGHTLQLSGFLTISAQKFSELPENVIHDWHQRGWLSVIYAQFFSSYRWSNLTHLLSRRGGWRGTEGAGPVSRGSAAGRATSNEPAQQRRWRDANEPPAPEGFRLARRPGRGKEF